MSDQWSAALGMTWGDLALTVVTATGIYLAVIALSRLFGQRQFSISSSYDLAFIFAMGALIGRVVLIRTSLLNAVAGLFTMFVLHRLMGWLHHHVPIVHRAVQNDPVLLVAHGEVVEENLRRARTSHVELHQQLRLQGIASLEDVSAVILERDGNVSAVRKGARLAPEVFADVLGGKRLFVGRRSVDHDGE